MSSLKSIIFVLCFYWIVLPCAKAEEVRIQFLGDTFLSYYAISKSSSTVSDPKIFTNIRGLLGEANLNIVNLEGVATHAFVPFQLKRYVLQMPIRTMVMLRKEGIHAATLANNHLMDYGVQGLFDTLYALDRVGIRYFGAGFNAEEANRPLIVEIGVHTFCFLSISRTLPSSFWATDSNPGTGHLTYEDTEKKIGACVKDGHITIPIFHWGEELSVTPKPYQKSLAKLSLKAGASAVIGHHPHIIQDIEFIDGKPILYSIGNFAFGTLSGSNKQEGMAAQLVLDGESFALEMVPLNVNNRKTNFIVTPITDPNEDPIGPRLQKGHSCSWVKVHSRWHCPLAKTAARKAAVP